MNSVFHSYNTISLMTKLICRLVVNEHPRVSEFVTPINKNLIRRYPNDKGTGILMTGILIHKWNIIIGIILQGKLRMYIETIESNEKELNLRSVESANNINIFNNKIIKVI